MTKPTKLKEQARQRAAEIVNVADIHVPSPRHVVHLNRGFFAMEDLRAKKAAKRRGNDRAAPRSQ